MYERFAIVLLFISSLAIVAERNFVLANNSANDSHAWWDLDYVLKADEFILEYGDNLLVASVGNRSYIDFSVDGIARGFEVKQSDITRLKIDQLDSIDAIYDEFKSLKSRRRRRTLMVIYGFNKLRGEDLSKFDVLLSIADRSFGLSNTVVVIAWETVCDIYAGPDDWTAGLKHELGDTLNGDALVGRIRRIGVQDFSCCLPPLGEQHSESQRYRGPYHVGSFLLWLAIELLARRWFLK
jgi:hypothetical protein